MSSTAPAEVRPIAAAAPEVPPEPAVLDEQAAPRQRPLWQYGLILGLLTAMGAFGIDAYLPAFPAIAGHFAVPEGRVQLSLVSYFVALALGQLVYGPVSDRIGRRGPLLFGFSLFSLAAVGCAFAPSIGVLIALRFVQGIGACAGMVLGRAIVRDVSSGERAAKLFSLMILVLGVSPILAPMYGSLVIAYLPWQAIFWSMGGLGLACLALILLTLEETNPAQRRGGASLGRAFAKYGSLLKNRTFVGTALIGGFSQGCVFAYLAGSPFVFIDLHGVSPTIYSLLFALNASALVLAAQTNVFLLRKLGASRLVFTASAAQTLATAALVVATLVHVDSVVVTAALLFITLGCHGILGPTTSLLAIEPFPESAGAASSLMGSLQFGVGAISSGLVSLFANGTSTPMAGVICGCAATALLLYFLTLRSRDAR